MRISSKRFSRQARKWAAPCIGPTMALESEETEAEASEADSDDDSEAAAYWQQKWSPTLALEALEFISFFVERKLMSNTLSLVAYQIEGAREYTRCSRWQRRRHWLRVFLCKIK